MSLQIDLIAVSHLISPARKWIVCEVFDSDMFDCPALMRALAKFNHCRMR